MFSIFWIWAVLVLNFYVNSPILCLHLVFCVLFPNLEDVKILSLIFSIHFVFFFPSWLYNPHGIFFLMPECIDSALGCSLGLKREMTVNKKLALFNWNNFFSFFTLIQIFYNRLLESFPKGNLSFLLIRYMKAGFFSVAIYLN